MKGIFFTLLFLILISSQLTAQAPRVPDRMTFADIDLRLTRSAQVEIQKDVDALHKNEKYFNMMLLRVNQYFPIIERVLKEENVPDDFKYLVIQESALIPDAVSSSNAVGFWQFKEETGEEVGLRIDRQIDERMNIVSSTRAAAKYFKKNNFYLKNWLYALSAYQAGLGGVEQYVDAKYKGAKHMEINKNTHWYIKKYIAYRIAFEDYIDRKVYKENVLYEYDQGIGKSLSQLAGQFDISEDVLYDYNKWLRVNRIPEDKTYTVIVPGYRIVKEEPIIARKDNGEMDYEFHDASLYPVIKTLRVQERELKINGIPGIIAREGEDIYALIENGAVGLKKFLKFNDIDITHRVIPGQVYYFKKKRRKAREHFHIVYPGETLWTVSQKYGIRMNTLMTKNRIRERIVLKPGRVLWLRFIRPADESVEYKEIEPAQIEPVIAHELPVTTDVDTLKENLQGNERGNMETDSVSTEVTVTTIKKTEADANTRILDKGIPEEYKAELEEENQNVKPVFHIVGVGETLYGLSKKYEVALEDLLKWNDIGLEDGIKIGQKIYLQKPYFQVEEVENINYTDKSYMEHKVVRGETLYSISRKYNASVEQIMKWNNKENNQISEGEILRIYE